MRREGSGRYQASTTLGETVRAYIPAPLPPAPPLAIDADLQLLLEQALLACGRLDAVSALLPDPNLFLYTYVRREAVLSSQIEGTQSSLSDLLLFELEEAPGTPLDDVVEVSNYVAAMDHALQRLAGGFPLSNRLLREIHGRLMQGARGAEKRPGEFRTSQNWIGGTRPGNAHFVPPPPQEIGACMSELERFIHAPTPGGALVKAALAHVQFETIHPFLDGNGRVGRLLIALILHHEGILRQPLLYLSLHFKQHRAEYYRQLDTVRTTGDWEAWLTFFLEGVGETANGAVSTAQRLVELFRQDSNHVATLGRSAPTAARVFDSLRHRPIADIDYLARQASVAFPTASRAVEALVKLGILRELTGQRRNRVFGYQRYIDILSEGATPLSR